MRSYIIMIWFVFFVIIMWFLFVQPPKEEAPSGKVQIKFAIWGGVAERQAWAKMERDFESKNPDIDVKVELIPIKYDEKLLAMLAADTAPDIFTLSIADFGPKNVFLPIDSFLVNDPNFDKDAFLPGLFETGYWRGQLFGVFDKIGTQLLFYNKTHFEMAGLPTPNEYAERGKWNWRTFREVCKKLVKRDKNGKIIRYAFQYYYPIWNYISLFGGQPFTDDYTKCNFDDPNVARALQELANLSLVDSVMVPFEMKKQFGESWQPFYNEKVSMFISGPYQIKRLAPLAGKYDVAPPPLEPGGKIMTIGGNVVTGIWRKSKHPQEAYRWLSYLWSPMAQKIWARLGFDLPGLKALAEHPEEWIDTTIVPEHFYLFYDVAKETFSPPAAIYPRIPFKLNVSKMHDTLWEEQIRAGRKTARQALMDMQAEAQQILDRGY